MTSAHGVPSRTVGEHFVKAHQDSDPENALFQARKTAELICRHVFAVEIGPPGRIMLDDLIVKLGQGKHIPPRMKNPLRTIQSYGNWAVHEEGDDEAPLNAAYIRPCIEALHQLMAWFYDEYLGLPRPALVSRYLSSAAGLLRDEAVADGPGRDDEPSLVRRDEAPPAADAIPAEAAHRVERIAAEGVAQWRLKEGAVVRCHAVSEDGDRVLAGFFDGSPSGTAGGGERLALFNRDGSEAWSFRLEEQVSEVAFSADSQVCLAGTWGGSVGAYVDTGWDWGVRLEGAISALVASYDAGRIACGTWAGEVRLLQREGIELWSRVLPEAVVQLALDPEGSALAVALADGTVLLYGVDGDVLWTRRLPSPVLHIARHEKETFVAGRDGSLLWLSDEGDLNHQALAGSALAHLDVSADGSTVVSIDRTGRLVVWERKQRRWDETLREMPEILSVAGQDDAFVVLLVYGSGEIRVINRRRLEVRIPLPIRVRSIAFSAAGIHATARGLGGEFLFVELAAIEGWLSPPDLQCRVATPSLIRGRRAQLSLDVRNDGGREARDVRIQVAGECLGQPTASEVRLLAPGQSRLVEVSVKPTEDGRIPIQVAVSCKDRMGRTFSWQHQHLVQVT